MLGLALWLGAVIPQEYLQQKALCAAETEAKRGFAYKDCSENCEDLVIALNERLKDTGCERDPKELAVMLNKCALAGWIVSGQHRGFKGVGM